MLTMLVETDLSDCEVTRPIDYRSLILNKTIITLQLSHYESSKTMGNERTIILPYKLLHSFKKIS